jgi:hypothetical protein
MRSVSHVQVNDNMFAVMLSDGRWYRVTHPTMAYGPDGYLSFVQKTVGSELGIVVNVALTDIKAVSYHGVPCPTSD